MQIELLTVEERIKWREVKEGGEGKGARAEEKEKEVKEQGLSQKSPRGEHSN